MMQRRTAVLSLANAALLAACGGGTDRTKAQVRLVNASTGYEALDLNVDDELRQGGVRYGESANYVEVEPNEPFSIRSPSSPTSLLTFSPSVSERRHYTVLAYGATGALKQVVLDDNAGEAADNRTQIRVINAAADAGALDVYVTNGSDTLAASVPLQAAAAVDAVGAYQTITSGIWRIRVTAASSKTDLRLDVPAIELASRQLLTLVLVPSDGGVLLRSLLLNQQGGIAAQAASLARVRGATGLVGVDAKVGADQILSPAGSTVVSNYTVVAAGTPAVTVTVGGVAVNAPPRALSPGRDYTLLLYGPAATPASAWIEDDNRLPEDRSKAKVRLVNGATDTAARLSLSVDQTLLASNVAAGLQSPYAPQDATSDGFVEVASTNTAISASAIERLFTAGSTYSVFLLGTSSLVVRRDR